MCPCRRAPDSGILVAVTMTARDALRAGKIFVAFQPVVDLSTGAIFSYEALARCSIDKFRSPPVLLAAAAEIGFLGQLGRALREMAIERCPNFPLFLNIHPDEFDEGWLVRPDDPIGFHDSDVYLEITESVPLSHYRYCHSVLHEIRGKGIKIAVDDLGAGYSNLKYIVDLAPEIVKLDRELIAGLTANSRMHKLVTSIVSLCRAQNARVVAEGIETEEELEAVMETGTHFGQGYYLARPHPEPRQIDWRTIQPLSLQVL